MKYDRKYQLYRAQENIYSALQHAIPNFDKCLLIGGTSLSRCWLFHRISYDLDFAMPPNINLVNDIVKALSQRKDTNILINRIDNNIYAHVFCEMKSDDMSVQVSFIEDRKFHKFDKIYKKMGDIEVATVSLDTLYFNKIRTIAGDAAGWGRQTLRDAFDLLVLSREYLPLPEFLRRSQRKYAISEELFFENLANFRWHEISDQKLEVSEQWQEFQTADKLQKALFDAAGFAPIPEDFWTLPSDSCDDDQQSRGPSQ